MLLQEFIGRVLLSGVHCVDFLLTHGIFDEYSVNHKKNFVDLHTQVHTHEIERQWVDAKSWMKRARGPGTMLQNSFRLV